MQALLLASATEFSCTSSIVFGLQNGNLNHRKPTADVFIFAKISIFLRHPFCILVSDDATWIERVGFSKRHISTQLWDSSAAAQAAPAPYKATAAQRGRRLMKGLTFSARTASLDTPTPLAARRFCSTQNRISVRMYKISTSLTRRLWDSLLR